MALRSFARMINSVSWFLLLFRLELIILYSKGAACHALANLDVYNFLFEVTGCSKDKQSAFMFDFASSGPVILDSVDTSHPYLSGL